MVLTKGKVEGHRVKPSADLLAAPPGPEIEAPHAQTGPDTIAKILFTSGST